MRRVTAVLCVVAGLAGCGGPDLLKTEPGPGYIGPGESVLVDNGQCPAGQVQKITGPQTLTASRTYACVKRP